MASIVDIWQNRVYYWPVTGSPTDSPIIGRPAGGGRSAAEARDDLLDAAERCFAEHGVTGTTMAMVGREARMSRSLVYRHVDGRDALVAAVVQRSAVRLVHDSQRLVDGSDDLETLLVDLFALIVGRLRENPALTSMMSGSDADVAALVRGDDYLGTIAHASVVEGLGRMPSIVTSQIRDDLTDREIADRLVRFGLLLLASPAGLVTTDDVASDVRRFLVPGLLRTPR